MIVSGNECGTNTRGNWVYFGYSKNSGDLVYVGTTMQRPSDRFRWHRNNKKDLLFKIHKNLDSVDEMLDCESSLIAKHKPKLNKKTKRHNDNRLLKVTDLEKRKGDKSWCQSCLKRRVNIGYNKCMWCSKK